MHTNKNYDGGNSFFAAQDAYLKHKEEQMQHLKNSLKDQLQEKENKRLLNITNLNL